MDFRPFRYHGAHCSGTLIHFLPTIWSKKAALMETWNTNKILWCTSPFKISHRNVWKQQVSEMVRLHALSHIWGCGKCILWKNDAWIGKIVGTKMNLAFNPISPQTSYPCVFVLQNILELCVKMKVILFRKHGKLMNEWASPLFSK